MLDLIVTALTIIVLALLGLAGAGIYMLFLFVLNEIKIIKIDLLKTEKKLIEEKNKWNSED